jgi:hypothetical protein
MLFSCQKAEGLGKTKNKKQKTKNKKQKTKNKKQKNKIRTFLTSYLHIFQDDNPF